MNVTVTGTRGIPNIMGGVETHCEELFPRVAAKGIQVTVIRRKHYIKDNLTEWNGVKFIDIAAPNSEFFEAIVHTFRAINKAKKIGTDIIHINSIGPALLVPYAKMLGMRVVFTHHGPDYNRDKWGYIAKIMLRLGECLACRFADDVIVISDVIRKLIAEKYGRRENVHLIYNGVPKPNICDYAEYFNELGIEKHKYFLATCRFVPEKNLHHLIAAWQAIPDNERSSWKLVLAGDADYNNKYSQSLKQQACNAGIVLTGFIKGRKLQSLLSNCAAFCLPSGHEGLPIALLEAMSYNAQVIVSDIPANREIALPDNCYFPVGDIPTLTEKLRHIITTKVTPITYDKIKKYDWDHIAEQVIAIYLSQSK